MSTPEDHAPGAPEQYVDANTAAACLNLPLKTVYSIIESGRLPALGFPVRIHRDDLAKVIERCRIKPGELRHLNQYAGRPVTDVAKWFRSKADKVHDTSVSGSEE